MLELSVPQVAAAGDIPGYGENRASLDPEHEDGRTNLRNELLYQAVNALREAQVAGRLLSDPLMEAILFTRARYLDTDQAIADHLWRMAALRLEPPYSFSSMNYLERTMARQELLRLRRDRDEFHNKEVDDIPPEWREALKDMAEVTLYASLWSN